ncbi:MAG: hypothetical protein KDA46_07530 [Parvularculaceae bacterium]|nr:hypothetical protein [Parvularculaceae bacterium]
MHDDKSGRCKDGAPVDMAEEAENEPRRAGALKKPDQPAKAKLNPKEARLAAALRDNLRRRKAAQRKAED